MKLQWLILVRFFYLLNIVIYQKNRNMLITQRKVKLPVFNLLEVLDENTVQLNSKANLKGSNIFYGTQDITNGILRLSNISEKMSEITLVNNEYLVNAASLSNSIFRIGTITANFKFSVNNVNTSNNNEVYNFMFLIDSATHYCNSLFVNGTSVTLLTNQGMSTVSVTGSTRIIQTISIIYKTNDTIAYTTITGIQS